MVYETIKFRGIRNRIIQAYHVYFGREANNNVYTLLLDKIMSESKLSANFLALGQKSCFFS